MKDLVFVHGWGSAPFVWQKIIPNFEGYQYHFVDLGFLGEENINIPNRPFIGIGHSLGGLWLLKHYPEQMSGFVSIASFNCFYKYTAQKILSKMQKNVVQHTAQQIKEFWHHAGMKQPKDILNFNAIKLVEGLKNLSQWQADIPPNIPIKILASRDDHIVPPMMTEDIWKNYNINWVNKGGHMLPLTQPQWCTDHIKEFLENAK